MITTSCRPAMMVATEKRHSKRTARYPMMPMHTTTSPMPPSVASSLPTRAPDGVQGVAYPLRLGVGLGADLHHGAAGELDREVQARGDEQAHGEQEGDQRDDVEHLRVAHEGDAVPDAEEFHVYTVTFLGS